MDFFDLSLDQEELLMRAKHEAEELAQFKDVDNLDADEVEILRALQKKLKKQTSRTPRLVVSANKGNFSNFRNKTFIPNASRVAAAVAPKTGKSTSEGGVATGKLTTAEEADGNDAMQSVIEGGEDIDDDASDPDEDDDVSEEPNGKAKEVQIEVKQKEKEKEKGKEKEKEIDSIKHDIKPVTKARAPQPQHKGNQRSMFNAFGDSDSDEEED